MSQRRGGAEQRRRAVRRRGRRLARVDNDLTAAHWAVIVEAWGSCAYCGQAGVPLQRDCVLPVARGGRYTWTNVVPACRSCNAGKCHHEVTGWLRRRGLDERRFLERHVEISARLRVHLDP